MELIIQKAVELGVYEIIPVETERSVVRLDEKKVPSSPLLTEISSPAFMRSTFFIWLTSLPSIMTVLSCICDASTKN